jgi:hypothetical protein
MPEKNFFLKLTGAVLLGTATLAAAIVIVLLLSPFILPVILLAFPFLVGIVLFAVAIMIVWAILYALAMLGVFVVYLFRPMKVETSGQYKIGKTKEAGLRESGESEKKKKK